MRDQTGNPLDRKLVLCESGSGKQEKITDANGKFAFDDLATHTQYLIKTDIFEKGFTNADSVVNVQTIDLSGIILKVSVHTSKLRGSVNIAGAPVEGALISLQETGISTYSASDGSYRFEHLNGVTYAVQIAKEGFEEAQPITLTLLRDEIKIRNFTLIRLSRAIYGVVYDHSGNRLQNAVIEIIDENSGSVVKRDTSDAAGIYMAKNLDTGKMYQVTAIIKGYAPESRSGLALGNGSISVDFSLTPIPNSIFGWVTKKSDGQFAEAASVKVTGISGCSWADTTDAFGRFAIPGLINGTYSIVAEKADQMSHAHAVRMTSTNETRVNLVLQYPGAVLGSVDYNQKGQAGATITAMNAMTGSAASTVSDAIGLYKISGLLDGEYTISCQKIGFTAQPSHKILKITSGVTDTLHFTLIAENNSIIGSVIDGHSRPLAAVKINAWNDIASDSATTDLNGQFSITNLVDGEYQVLAQRSGYRLPTIQQVTLSGGQPVEVSFILSAIQNTISGFVQNAASSAPVANAMVIATNTAGSVYKDTTLANGSFLLELQPGEYHIKSEKSGFESSPEVLVYLAAGKSIVQNLLLTPIYSTSSISGTVQRKGMPVEGASIACRSLTDASFHKSTNSSADGWYHFSGLSVPGSYILEASKDGLMTLVSPK
ncbi:carboxypeptidase regulatory-like domain-containing protein [candidate division KSB1 bacterium]|nr:carboxypeptidase regulatory-like domain-containing protein [candidate division KSB1 bacterium]